ncbi:hypothetical protein C3H36_05305 [Campylobacter jejuni]|nr:restriction endonuclease subunit S [Campylobacter jejuni]RTJ99855.1 hypothetical protein C3H36_05305 [Campylobacter jejuni]
MQNNTMTNLPQGWEVKKLGEIGEIFSGSSAPQNKEYFINGTYKFVRTKDLSLKGKTKNLIEIETNINDLAINILQLIEAPKGAVLFPKSGASIGTNNRAMLGFNAYIVSHLGVFYLKVNITNHFVYYFLSNIDFLNFCENPLYPSLRISKAN